MKQTESDYDNVHCVLCVCRCQLRITKTPHVTFISLCVVPGGHSRKVSGQFPVSGQQWSNVAPAA